MQRHRTLYANYFRMCTMLLLTLMSLFPVRAADADVDVSNKPLKVLIAPAQSSGVRADVLREAFTGKQIIRFNNTTLDQVRAVLGTQLPLPSSAASGGLVLRTVAVRATETGSVHVFTEYVDPSVTSAASEAAFDAWAGRESFASDAQQKDASTPRKFAQENPGSAWTEVAQVLKTGTSAAGNRSSVTVRVYRLNSTDTAYDFYMVLFNTEAIPNFSSNPCLPTNCGWYQSARDVAASMAYGPGRTAAVLLDHGPTGTITTETTGFSIGGNLGANASGPMGGVSVTFSQTWSQPSVTTTDKTTPTVAEWREDFSDWNFGIAGTSSGTFLSYQGAIFRVPAATPVVTLSYSVKTHWVYRHNAIMSDLDPLLQSESLDIYPPQFSVSPTTLTLPAGSSAAVQVNASIRSATGEGGLQLGWSATQTGGNWFSVAPSSGSGTCSAPAGTCPQVSINTGTPNGQVGFIQFNTNPAGGAPVVGQGPIVVKVIVGSRNDTSTVVTSSSPSALFGDNVTFTAAVTTDQGALTGTVTFFDGNTALGGAVPLVNGRATMSTSGLSRGTHVITATYNGDDSHLPSTSSAITQVITGSQVRKLYQQGILGLRNTAQVQWLDAAPIYVHAEAASGDDHNTYSGAVTYVVDGTNVIARGEMKNVPGINEPEARLQIDWSRLDVGQHSGRAFWAGNELYRAAETSAFLVPDPYVFTIHPATASVSVAADAATPFTGQSVTFTAQARITSGHDGSPDAPNGSILFSEGGKALATVALTNGSANFTTSALSAGAHTITATLQARNIATAQATFSLNVQPNDIAAVVTASPTNPAFGEPVTLQTQISSATANGQTPSGTVTFSDGAETLLTVPVQNGTATLSNYRLLTGGPHSITAVYNGDGVFAPTTSKPVALNVSPAGSQTRLTVSQPSPSVYGEFVDLNVSVTNAAGAALANAEAGTVTFSARGAATTLTLGTAPLSNGNASLRVNTLSAGEYNFVASYSGTTDYQPSTSNPQAFAVSPAGTRTSITGPVTGTSTTVGQTVTVTVRVAVLPPGSGTINNDTVAVSDPNYPDSSCVANLQGSVSPFTGSCSFVPKTPGTRQLVAVYQANDLDFSQSSSAPGIALDVKPSTSDPVFTNLTPSQSVPFGTQSISLSGVLAAPGPVYPPVGEFVTVSIGTVSQRASLGPNGTFTIAQFPISGLDSDQFTITYSYAGNTNFGARTDTSTKLSITNAQPVFSQLQREVNVNVGTATVGLSGTISAPGPLYPAVGEKVTITIGGVSQSVAIGANGTFVTPDFPVASLSAANSPYTITYSYAGNQHLNSRTNSNTVLRILSSSVTVIVSVSPEVPVAGQPVLVSFAVRPATAGSNNLPTGTVKVDAVPGASCTASLSAGSCTITFANDGAKTLTATYSGDSNFAPSTSAPQQIVVGKLATVAVLTSTPNPSTVNGTVSFRVAVTSPGGGTPAGNVTLVEHVGQQVTVLAQGNLDSNGIVVFPVSSLPSGGHEIDATYGGNDRYLAATSNAVNQQVAAATP